VIKPVYADEDFVLFHENCRKVLPMLADDSIDSIVCDPPYELTAGKKGGTGEASLNLNSPAGRSRISTGGGFMGQQWDATGVAFDPATWKECLRVLKPGGHLVAFGGTRTYHRMACAIEDAGFEVRDSLHWLYGSGFPKGLDVSKAIDKAAGAEREVVGKEHRASGNAVYDKRPSRPDGLYASDDYNLTAPATDEAKQWSGWNVALKPAHEPIILARKPLSEKTVAANVLKHGTGAMNVDACRVGSADKLVRPFIQRDDNEVFGKGLGAGVQEEPSGRWPPNILLTHSADCVPIGTQKVRNSSGSIKGDEPSAVTDAVYAERESGCPGRRTGDADGMETVEKWECAEDCPVAGMDGQSGISKSTVGKPRKSAAPGEGVWDDAYWG
jgi:hypothetical protein